ncbi:hypothetical protein [Aquifex aeolicus]|uniref:Uncharacterized protein aq_267 n=1 Tax=Aquifex aeolicus (strain VF5) TaxID=224324 RepID=Y267_AQUAE|nr:hypothetical protein [Aquifex aeolicus]O66624.1 RecName: Full=Uncharacterized protein aq_267 [Aquifex aeolicus VF5]AAC06585.1 putative protein [Aquifex aeolicus VF5]
MFYVSKVTPFFFALALLNLLISLFIRLSQDTSLFFVSLVFGFVGLTLMGAMYQIIPNSQNRKLSIPKVSYLVFFLILVSFYEFYTGNTESGSLFLFLGSLIFFFHLLLNVKNFYPLTVRFLLASMIYLVLSALFLYLHFKGFLPVQLSVHTLTVGSMLNAIYGVELAWIPMLIMETLNIRKGEKLFTAKQVSTLALLLAFWSMNYKLIALAGLLEFGVALYFLYLNYELFKRKRMPTPPPNVVKIFLFALLFLPLGMLLGIFSASHAQALPFSLRLHLDLILYGFGAFTIFGGMLHLLPRIVWNWKVQEKENPGFTMGDLVNERELQTFLEYSALLYALFLAVDSLFSPLHVISTVVYLVIMALFLKEIHKAFLYIFK